MHLRGAPDCAMGIEDIFLGQPLKYATVHAVSLGQARNLSRTATIELAGSWCGEQGVRARLNAHIKAQFIPADDATRGMDDVDMARLDRTRRVLRRHRFRVKGPLHQQRPAVTLAGKTRACAFSLETQFQRPLPAAANPPYGSMHGVRIRSEGGGSV